MVEQIRQHMPVFWKSPNRIDPTDTFVAFLMVVLVGPNASLIPACYAVIRHCMRCSACAVFPRRHDLQSVS